MLIVFFTAPGSIVGGPIAQFLIKRNQLTPQEAVPLSIGLSHVKERHGRVDVESTERYIENKSNK
jgi:sodium--glutamate symport carrier gltS